MNIDRDLSVAARISVADTSALRKQGLLSKEKLEEGGGIWIAPCEAVHTFGMRMNIDVVFLDRELKVKKVVEALSPRRMTFCVSAYSVLELEAGVIQRTKTQVGDRLRFRPLYDH